jgi:hypothetical protein
MPDSEPGHIPTSNYKIDQANGIVTDTVTFLTWQEPTPTRTYTWAEARCYCAGLALGGHDDWRLPTRIELISLIDETVPAPAPHINGTAFPSTIGGSGSQGTIGDGYWASTLQVGNPTAAWDVHFDYSYADDTFDSVMVEQHVRCVRTPVPNPIVLPKEHWTIQNGAVIDNYTGRTWQQSTPVSGGDDRFGNYSWSNAGAYCASLQGGGWRLPTVKELATLVDVTTMSPTVDPTAFPGAPAMGSGGAISDSFWSATLGASFTTAGLLVDFSDGRIGDDGVQYPYHVRCVR